MNITDLRPRAEPHLTDPGDAGKSDWVMRNPALFFGIFGSIMFSIIAFCAYALWRGTFRPFWPCCPSSAAKKEKRISIMNMNRNNHTDGQPTNVSTNMAYSPSTASVREPGPNLQFWKKKDTRSGDWGHHIYLTDLKRQEEAKAKAGGDLESQRSGLGGGVKYDEEAVREAAAAAAGGNSSPKSENDGRRSRGMLRKSVGVASPLREVGHGHGSGSGQGNGNTRSPGSTAHSHTHLMNSINRPRPQSSTRSSSGSPGSSTSIRNHRLSPASTMLSLTNPALPPRHASLYSPVSGPNRLSHQARQPWAGIPGTLTTPPGGSPIPSPLSNRNTMAAPPSVSAHTNVHVPSVARAAYSPFAPKVEVPVVNGGGAGIGGELPGPRGILGQNQGRGQGQRGSVISERGFAV